jgi:hypothetical protein
MLRALHPTIDPVIEVASTRPECISDLEEINDNLWVYLASYLRYRFNLAVARRERVVLAGFVRHWAAMSS